MNKKLAQIVVNEMNKKAESGNNIPFVYVKNLKTGKPLKNDGTDATNLKDVAIFKEYDDAIDLVDMLGIDAARVECNTKEEYEELLSSLR